MSEQESQNTQSTIALKINEILPDLTKSEAKIARYILLNETRLGFETGASVAAKAGVSEITVSRFLKRLGYKGITGLKADLRAAAADGLWSPEERNNRLSNGSFGQFLRTEAESLLALADQLETDTWHRMITSLGDAERVFVTGFQSISGVAQDFARRLNMVRDSVHYVSPNTSGLLEWLHDGDRDNSRDVLIVVDIVPFANDAVAVCRLAKAAGMTTIVTTDEFNNWAYDYTDLVFHVRTKTGLLLETTAPLVSLHNYMIHGLALKNPGHAERRLEEWQKYLSELGLYFS